MVFEVELQTTKTCPESAANGQKPVEGGQGEQSDRSQAAISSWLMSMLISKRAQEICG